MLAEALKGGKGFSGKIDYLYEGKLEERGLVNKQAQVITHSDNLRVPYDYTDLKGRNRMKADFISQSKEGGKTIPKNSIIGEHILSFTPEDRKKLTPNVIKEITDEYIKMAGLDKTQYVGISHNDTQNYHVHILFNKRMNDGTMYKEWKEKNKTLERGIALALKYDFRLVGNQHRIADSKEVAMLRSEMIDIKELRDSNILLQTARNLKHLEKMCENNKHDFSHDKLTGCIEINHKEFKERDLKAMFLLNRNEADNEKKQVIATVETMKKENQVFVDAKSIFELKRGCNTQNIKFIVNAENKTVSVGGKEYQEKDLQNLFINNYRQIKLDIKEMKDENPLLNIVKNFSELETLCEKQKIKFMVNAENKTISVGNREYQEKDLQHVFNENIRIVKGEVKAMKEENPLLNSVKNIEELKETCNYQNTNFKVNAESNTVSVGNKEYQEKELQNVFNENTDRYLRFNSVESQSEFLKVINELEKAISRAEKIEQINEGSNSNDNKIKPQITVKDETINEAKRKRRKSGYKIKIDNINQKKQQKTLSNSAMI